MGLISFIKNLFKQKDDDLWVEPRRKKNHLLQMQNNDILEINTLTGEVIIKGKIKETYPVEYWFPD
jgi:hypothetical protein